MLSTAFYAGSFSLTPLAIPTFATSVLALVLGGMVVLRERGSGSSGSFLNLCLAISVWLLGFSFMFGAADSETAYVWAKAAFVGFPFIPAAMYHFSTKVLGIYRRRRGLVWLGWAGAAAGAGLVVATDVFVSEMHVYSWGFYPRFHVRALAFCVFAAGFLGLSLWELGQAYRLSDSGAAKLRARAFLFGFGVAGLAFLDHLTAFGVELVPVGFLPTVAFLGIVAFAIWKYRLADLTPSFVADQLIRSLPEMLIVCDTHGRIQLVNPALCAGLGYGFEELRGEAVELLTHDPSSGRILRKALRLPASSDQELSLKTRDGETMEVSLSSAELVDRNGFRVGSIIVARDVRTRKQMEGELVRRALFDHLTGLPNRTLLLDRVGRALAHASSRGVSFALLCVDLDGFREVKNTLGHARADEIVVHAGQRLVASAREGDTVARLEDNRFVIVLRHIIDASAGLRAARRIQKTLAPAFSVEGQQLSLSASIGLAHSTTGYDKAEEILRDALAALGRARERGPGQVKVFDRNMRAQAVSRMRMEEQLKRALETHQFQLHFQPIVSLSTRELRGYEALLRWHHPERGWVGPEEFIPVAESSGLIVPIGAWVLRQACQQVSTWREEYPHLATLQLHVNLSPREIQQPQLIQKLESVLEETGLAADHLVLEITEAALAEHPKSVLRTLNSFRARGVHVCIDDYGTGYSSLAHLRRFPVEALKIDRSFVSGTQGRSDVEIIRSIIALGEILGTQVIAEGIETREQLTLLRSLGCAYGQGNLFSVPVESPEADGLLLAPEAAGHPARTPEAAACLARASDEEAVEARD